MWFILVSLAFILTLHSLNFSLRYLLSSFLTFLSFIAPVYLNSPGWPFRKWHNLSWLWQCAFGWLGRSICHLYFCFLVLNPQLNYFLIFLSFILSFYLSFCLPACLERSSLVLVKFCLQTYVSIKLYLSRLNVKNAFFWFMVMSFSSRLLSQFTVCNFY